MLERKHPKTFGAVNAIRPAFVSRTNSILCIDQFEPAKMDLILSGPCSGYYKQFQSNQCLPNIGVQLWNHGISVVPTITTKRPRMQKSLNTLREDVLNRITAPEVTMKNPTNCHNHEKLEAIDKSIAAY